MFRREEKIVVFSSCKKQSLNRIDIILMLGYWKYHDLEENGKELHASPYGAEELSYPKSSLPRITFILILYMNFSLEYLRIIFTFWCWALNHLINLVEFFLKTVSIRHVGSKSLVANFLKIIAHARHFQT